MWGILCKSEVMHKKGCSKDIMDTMMMLHLLYWSKWHITWIIWKLCHICLFFPILSIYKVPKINIFQVLQLCLKMTFLEWAHFCECNHAKISFFWALFYKILTDWFKGIFWNFWNYQKKWNYCVMCDVMLASIWYWSWNWSSNRSNHAELKQTKATGG